MEPRRAELGSKHIQQAMGLRIPALLIARTLGGNLDQLLFVQIEKQAHTERTLPKFTQSARIQNSGLHFLG